MKDLDPELYFHFVMADYESGKVKQNPEDGEFVWLTIEEISKLDNLLSEIRDIFPYLFNGTDKVISYKAVYDKGNNMIKFELEKP